MSTLADPVVEPLPESVPRGPSDEHPRASSRGGDPWMRVVRRVAYALFALQFVGMAIWSSIVYSRYLITHDGGLFDQIFYLTTHGQAVPYSTFESQAGWKDHFTLAWWPLSLVDRISPHLMIMWTQDAAIVAAEIVAFAWICQVASTPKERPVALWRPAVLAGFGCLLLVANPWNWWAITFDIHIETFACPFIVGAAWEFSRGRNRRAWVLVGLTLLFGDVMGSWVVGLGISALIAAWWNHDRRHLRTAALLGGAGIGWIALAAILGAGKGTSSAIVSGFEPGGGPPTPGKLSFVSTAKTIVTHPLTGLETFWRHIPNVVADLSPTGWIGIFTPWTIGVPLVVLLTNNMSSYASGVFSEPGFQSAPVYEFGAVGFIIILAWLQGRLRVPQWPAPRIRQWLAPRVRQWLAPGVRPWLAATVTAVVAVNAVLWGAIWTPRVLASWLQISPKQAQVLREVQRQIPANAEVVASQGIVGRFVDRAYVYPLMAGSATDPLHANDVWFIIVPNSGLELQEVDGAMGAIGKLASVYHAKLIVGRSGVWAFELHRPPNLHSVHFPQKPSIIPGWAAAGPAGNVVRDGPPADWHVAANGKQGYIVAKDYWRRSPGSFTATVTLSSASTVYAEVWDQNTETLLARTEVPPTNVKTTIALPFTEQVDYPPVGGNQGFWPYYIHQIPAPAGQRLEIRIWAPAGSSASIYQLSLFRFQNGIRAPEQIGQ